MARRSQKLPDKAENHSTMTAMAVSAPSEMSWSEGPRDMTPFTPPRQRTPLVEKAELDGPVTVTVGCPNLEDVTGAGFDHGYGNHLTLVGEDPRHAQLSANDCVHPLTAP